MRVWGAARSSVGGVILGRSYAVCEDGYEQYYDVSLDSQLASLIGDVGIQN